MVFASCEGPEGVLYEGDGQDLSFASTLMSLEFTAEDEEVVKVPIYRGNKTGEYSVQVKLDANNPESTSTFNLKSEEIKFADGESVAYAEFSYDFDNLGFGKEYSMGLKLLDVQELSPSGVDSLKLNFARKLTYEVLGEGSFTSEMFGGTFGFNVEKAKEANVYLFKDIIGEGYDLMLVLNDDENEMVSFGPMESGFNHSSYGMVWIQGLTYARSGKQIHILCEYFVPGVGSFGEFNEYFTLP